LACTHRILVSIICREKRVRLTDSATDVIINLADKIGLQTSTDGWALFEVTPQSEHYVRGPEYIGDVLADWENSKRSSMNMTGYKVMMNSAANI
jgi:hypothetical protein